MIHDSVYEGTSCVTSFRFRLFGRRWFWRARSARAAHDIPNDVDGSRIRQTRGRPAAVCWCACRSKAMRDVDFPEQPGGYLDIEKLAPAAARRGHPVDRRVRRDLRRRCAPAEAPRRRDPGVASNPTDPSRPTSRRSRMSPGRSCRTAPTSSGTRCCSTCCSNTRSTRIDPRFRSIPGWSGWPRAWSPCCDSCRPAARCAPMNSWAIRAGCRSIRAGIRRPGASSNWDSCTSWTAPTTCCSCSAW